MRGRPLELGVFAILQSACLASPQSFVSSPTTRRALAISTSSPNPPITQAPSLCAVWKEAPAGLAWQATVGGGQAERWPLDQEALYNMGKNPQANLSDSF